MSGATNKFLIFSILTEYYAIPIIRVTEIIRYEKITPVRDSQNYLKGVINLRGKIIPIIDMRTKFSIQEEAYNDRTIFIIVEINGQIESYNTGIAVDAVHEVIDIMDDKIEDAPKVGLRLKGQYLKGIAKIENNMAMILDIDKILTTDEILELQNAAS
jgi:purine-binding chemotaxis protein CheW